MNILESLGFKRDQIMADRVKFVRFINHNKTLAQLRGQVKLRDETISRLREKILTLESEIVKSKADSADSSSDFDKLYIENLAQKNEIKKLKAIIRLRDKELGRR